MEKFKGTKGDWVCSSISEDSNGYISVEIPMGNITVYNGIYPYAFSNDKEKCVEILEANAKLIAAAPEMLELFIRISEAERYTVSLDMEINALIKKITE